jgi:hypothetical protein
VHLLLRRKNPGLLGFKISKTTISFSVLATLRWSLWAAVYRRPGNQQAYDTPFYDRRTMCGGGGGDLGL